jgi:hypothetical protein
VVHRAATKGARYHAHFLEKPGVEHAPPRRSSPLALLAPLVHILQFRQT